MAMAMAFPLHSSLLFFLALSSLISFSHCNLTLDYYNQTCPDFHSVIQEACTQKQLDSPTTAAATIRLFFHDCVIEGCDASLLISSNSFHKAERDSELNQNLPGDAFDLVARAKTALELKCPGVVSCSDILAVAARNLVTMVGGPYYEVLLGRKDSLVSDPDRVARNIATTDMPMTEIISLMASKGFRCCSPERAIVRFWCGKGRTARITWRSPER